MSELSRDVPRDGSRQREREEVGKAVQQGHLPRGVGLFEARARKQAATPPVRDRKRLTLPVGLGWQTLPVGLGWRHVLRQHNDGV